MSCVQHVVAVPVQEGREGMTIEAILHNSIDLEDYVDELRKALEG